MATFREAAEWYVELKTALAGHRCASTDSRLVALYEFFGDRECSEINQRLWLEYKIKRIAGKISRGKVKAITINAELDLAKRVLARAVESELIATNGLTRVKLDKVKPNSQAPLREEHLQDLIDACDDDLLTKVYIVVAFDTGMRRTELLRLTWGAVNFGRGVIDVHHGKGGKQRYVIATRRALEWLMRMPRYPNCEDIFANPRTGRRLDSTGINFRVRRVVLKSGIERFYPGRKIRIHGMRHGHATAAVQRNVDIRSVQAQLGHASLATTERYVHEDLTHRIAMRERYEAGIPENRTRKGPHRAPTGGAISENKDLDGSADAVAY